MVRAAVLAVLLLGVWCGASSSARADELRIQTRDGLRTAILQPASRRHAPTIIVLHGALVSAEYTAGYYGFTELARRRGFAAVFPRGVSLQWNDGRNGAWGSEADDVGFLKRLTRDLVARGTSDPARIYLVGVSNGGMMALRMLCEAPEAFAGIATVIASMPSAVGKACRSRGPMSVIMLNGTADPLVRYGGGEVGVSGLQGDVWPVERTAAFLGRRNGCASASKALISGRRGASGEIRVTRLDWRQCSSERGVTLYRVEGGGHQVFGVTNFVPFLLGPGTNRISAPSVIMAAFAKGEL
jgi:polyhydroxybutyrate depolymerase